MGTTRRTKEVPYGDPSSMFTVVSNAMAMRVCYMILIAWVRQVVFIAPWLFFDVHGVLVKLHVHMCDAPLADATWFRWSSQDPVA